MTFNEGPYQLPQEWRLPVYVPLQMIDNADPFPILRYLAVNNSLFRGAKGIARLSSLASRGRILLMLDGYDEIPWPARDEKNFVLQEIRALLGLAKPDVLPSTYTTALAALERAKIWLASRRDFFERYPVIPRDTRTMSPADSAHLRLLAAHPIELAWSARFLKSIAVARRITNACSMKSTSSTS